MKRITVDIMSDEEIIIYSQQNEITEIPMGHYLGRVGDKTERERVKNIEEALKSIRKFALEVIDNKKTEIEKLRKKEK